MKINDKDKDENDENEDENEKLKRWKKTKMKTFKLAEFIEDDVVKYDELLLKLIDFLRLQRIIRRNLMQNTLLICWNSLLMTKHRPVCLDW